MGNRKCLSALAIAGLFSLSAFPAPGVERPPPDAGVDRQTRTLVVAASNNFPPINFLDGKGDLTGFARDISTAVAKAVGADTVYLHSSRYSEELEWLETGKAGLIHDTAYSEERALFLDFTDPILEMSEVIFTRADQVNITGFGSLRGKSVAAVRQHISHLYLEKYPEIHLRVVGTPTEAFYLLVHGDVDAFVYPKQVVMYMAQELRIGDKIKVVGDPLRILRWSMVVKKGNKEVLDLLNEGIRKIRASGEYDSIYARWFGDHLLAGYSKKEVKIITAAAVVLSLLVGIAASLLVMNVTLRKTKNRLSETVSELHSAETKVSKALLEMEAIMEVIPDIFFMIDLDANLVKWNKTSEVATGLAPEMLKNRPVLELFVEEDRPSLIASIRKCIEEGESKSEVRVLNAHGGSTLYQFLGVTVKDEGGDIIGITGTGRDITERKQAEEAVRERYKVEREHAWLLDVISRSLNEIYVFDPMTLHFKFANAGGLRNIGYSLEELASMTPVDIKPEFTEEAFRAMVQPLVSGEREILVFETVHRRKDGSDYPIEAHLQLVSATGAVVFLSIINDITERKRAEEALRETERKYRFLVANAHEAIFIAQDNVVKFPNGKALEMTGYSTEELAGVPFTDLIHPEDRGEVIERYIDRLRGEPPRETYPFRIMKKTGEEIWAQLTAELIDWEGRPGVLCFLRDITKERNLEAQFLQAQKMEAVGTLAGGIAHDFNNALTGIVGFGELLRMRMAGDEQALHDLDEILHCGERAATLTRQLLTFARRQVTEPVNVNLSTLVADLMKLIGKVVGEHIEVKTSLEKNVPTIHADRGQIEQVVMNLCLNARDAMPEGGRLTVETEEVYLDEEYVSHNPYMKTGRYALLTVSDTGIGMDEKTRDRVFEPFFTTKGPDKGTGLGLAMVYGIVKQHGGFIHLYSEPGKGTAFKVYFLAVEAQSDAVPVKRVEEIVRGGTETILLAEDEEAIRALAERVLRGFGYTVLVARNGEEAIEIFRQHKEIVLAVLDVVMPRKGGKEAFEEMHKRNPRLKVIFMSGYSANGIHDSFVLFPGTPFLQKPFGPTILARKVREALDTQ